MADFRKRQRARKLLYSNVTVVLLLVLLFFALKGLWGVFERKRMAEESLARAQTQYEELMKRKEFLSSEIALLDTDDGIESKLRERYSIAKSGEKVVVVITEEGASSTEQTQAWWWSRLWNWFKK